MGIYCARKDGLNGIIVAKAAMWGILGCFWGSSMLALDDASGGDSAKAIQILLFISEGKSVFTALFGAGLFGATYLCWKKQPLLPYADAAAPAVALGYAVARIGCFLNGCCFGTPCELPWAVVFPQGTMALYSHWESGWIDANAAASLPVHPVQLYHAAAGLLLFFLLRRVRGGCLPGTRLALGMGGYGLLRFFLQFLRGDRVPVFGWLDINQIFSIGFVMIAVLLVWNRIRKQASSPGDLPVPSPAEELQPESS